jgi:hypothetical protein
MFELKELFFKAQVAIKRIRDFLLNDEINEKDVSYENIDGVAVKLDSVNLGWEENKIFFDKFVIYIY